MGVGTSKKLFIITGEGAKLLVTPWFKPLFCTATPILRIWYSAVSRCSVHRDYRETHNPSVHSVFMIMAKRQLWVWWPLLPSRGVKGSFFTDGESDLDKSGVTSKAAVLLLQARCWHTLDFPAARKVRLTAGKERSHADGWVQGTRCASETFWYFSIAPPGERPWVVARGTEKPPNTVLSNAGSNLGQQACIAGLLPIDHLLGHSLHFFKRFHGMP